MEDIKKVNCNDVLSKLEDELIAVLDSLHLRLKTPAPPQTLYHYTNDTGLHGILESGRLRLSNIFSLNDPSEIRHGLFHAAETLNNETSTGTPEVKEFAKKFASFCQNGVGNSAYFFVCSFSKNINDLGQWRAYADNGQGYALEFEANLIADGFASLDGGSNNRRNNTFPIIYKDIDIVDIYRQFIALCLPHISRKCQGLSSKIYLSNLGALLSIYVLEVALYFKHESYANEYEFRFLETITRNEDPLVKWRAKSSELVAFRDFSWRDIQPSVLKRIIIGPAADRYKAKAFVKACLTAYHPKSQGEVEIDYCNIPYRA